MLLTVFLAAVLGSGSLAPGAVEKVFPSGPLLPINCLRISLRFKEAQNSAVLTRLALRDLQGSIRQHPFLEQELWSPDRTILTVLFDPGRLKQGIGPNELLGAPLAGLPAVVFTFDGMPLKQWRISTKHCRPVDSTDWRLEPVRAKTRSTLRLRFPEAVDYQAEHLLVVLDAVGRRIPGNERLTESETAWEFEPAIPWKIGQYKVLPNPEFENVCGDRIGENFEYSRDVHLKSSSAVTFKVDE